MSNDIIGLQAPRDSCNNTKGACNSALKSYKPPIRVEYTCISVDISESPLRPINHLNLTCITLWYELGVHDKYVIIPWVSKIFLLICFLNNLLRVYFNDIVISIECKCLLATEYYLLLRIIREICNFEKMFGITKYCKFLWKIDRF